MHPERASGRGPRRGPQEQVRRNRRRVVYYARCAIAKHVLEGSFFYVLRNFVAQGHRTNCTCRRTPHTRGGAYLYQNHRANCPGLLLRRGMGTLKHPLCHIVFRRVSSARARRYLPTRSVGMGIEDRRTWLPAKPCAAAIRRCAVVVFPGFSGGVGVISNPRRTPDNLY